MWPVGTPAAQLTWMLISRLSDSNWIPAEGPGPRRRSSTWYPCAGLQDSSSAWPLIQRATTLPPMDPITFLAAAVVVPVGFGDCAADDRVVGLGVAAWVPSCCLTWPRVSGCVPVPVIPDPIALTARMPIAMAAAAARIQPPTDASQRGREENRRTRSSMPAPTLTAH